MTLHKADYGFGDGPKWELEASQLRAIGLYAEEGSEGKRNADGTVSVRHLKADGIGEFGPIYTFRHCRWPEKMWVKVP